MSLRTAVVVSAALLAVVGTPAILGGDPAGRGPVVSATIENVFSVDAATGRTRYLGHRVDGGPLITPPADTRVVYRVDPHTGHTTLIARRQSDGTLAVPP